MSLSLQSNGDNQLYDQQLFNSMTSPMRRPLYLPGPMAKGNMFEGLQMFGDAFTDLKNTFSNRKLKKELYKESLPEYYTYTVEKDPNDPNEYVLDNRDLYDAMMGEGTLRTPDVYQSDMQKYSMVNFDPESGMYNTMYSSRPINEDLYSGYSDIFGEGSKSLGQFIQDMQGNPELMDLIIQTESEGKSFYPFMQEDETIGATDEPDFNDPDFLQYYYNTMMGNYEMGGSLPKAQFRTPLEKSFADNPPEKIVTTQSIEKRIDDEDYVLAQNAYLPEIVIETERGEQDKGPTSGEMLQFSLPSMEAQIDGTNVVMPQFDMEGNYIGQGSVNVNAPAPGGDDLYIDNVETDFETIFGVDPYAYTERLLTGYEDPYRTSRMPQNYPNMLDHAMMIGLADYAKKTNFQEGVDETLEQAEPILKALDYAAMIGAFTPAYPYAYGYSMARALQKGDAYAGGADLIALGAKRHPAVQGGLKIFGKLGPKLPSLINKFITKTPARDPIEELTRNVLEEIEKVPEYLKMGTEYLQEQAKNIATGLYDSYQRAQQYQGAAQSTSPYQVREYGGLIKAQAGLSFEEWFIQNQVRASGMTQAEARRAYDQDTMDPQEFAEKYMDADFTIDEVPMPRLEDDPETMPFDLALGDIEIDEVPMPRLEDDITIASPTVTGQKDNLSRALDSPFAQG